MNAMITVEVAYARADTQKVIMLEVPLGTTAKGAITLSGILDLFPEINLQQTRIGIYSRPCAPDALLRPRDRVEIYRPLLADPKEVRRRRAAEGKIMRGRRPA